MEISQLRDAAQIAVLARVQDQMQVQGAEMTNMIAAAPSPAGSVNLPSQGRHIDARA